MSGRSNIIHWLNQNGIEESSSLVDHLFNVAKSQRRLMTEEEIFSAIKTHKEAV
jgi:hypothetical protein